MRRKYQPKISVLTIVIVAGCAVAQNPAFEVASVKPAPPVTGGTFRVGSRGGGAGTLDPTHYSCSNCSLMMLVEEAYDVKPYQLSAPGWMGTELYEISAKVPDGATKEQVHGMLQNLLAERFKLTLHHEQREMQVYSLVIAKGGSKLREHVETAPKEERGGNANDPADREKRMQEMLANARSGDGLGPGRGVGPDGYPMVNNNCISCSATINGKTRLQANGQTIAQFATQLTMRLGKPVTDLTGLTGKYDYSLTFDGGSDPTVMRRMRGMPDVMPGRMAQMQPPPPPPPSDSGTPISGADPAGGITLEAAIQAQLGLKLELKKAPADMIVVDHAERTPTEN